MPHNVVVFTENNARIIYTEDCTAWSERTNALIDPDMEPVKGTPPHFWKMQDGKITVMTEEEQRWRLSHHADKGVNNDLTSSPVVGNLTKKEANLPEELEKQIITHNPDYTLTTIIISVLLIAAAAAVLFLRHA